MEFELQPRLQGELLELRPLEPADREALWQAARDPLIWEQHPERRYEREVFDAFFDGALASGGALAVVERATGRVIGTSRYARLDAEKRQVEIGWTFLERAYWGGRYNGELKRLMVEHAFRFVERVVFSVAETNLRSQQAVRKIGGVEVAREERPGSNGRGIPSVLFALTRERWKEAHA